MGRAAEAAGMAREKDRGRVAVEQERRDVHTHVIGVTVVDELARSECLQLRREVAKAACVHRSKLPGCRTRD